MTSDKNGPAHTASPALEDDLEITRDRKALTGEQAPADAPEKRPAGAGAGRSSVSSAPTRSDAARAGTGSAGAPSAAGTRQNEDLTAGPVAVPAPPAKQAAPTSSAKPSTPPTTGGSDAAVPTTGGIWRSAYEAGRTGKDANPPAPPAPPAPTEPAEAKAPQGLGSAIGRVTTKGEAPAPQSAPVPAPDANAKSWNRVSAPAVPPAPPAPPAAAAAEGTDGVRAGAMKAAQAALDAARSAAKKVSSIMPDDESRSAANPTPSEAKARPEMHYTAGGVRGTAVPIETQPAGASGSQTAPQPASGATPEAARSASAPVGPRRVRLAVSRVDPWSVMKLAFLLAVAIAIMTVVATAVFWSVLDGFAVFTTVQDFVSDAVGPQSNVNLTQFVEFPRVISLATLISICNIVLLTAIATIMAFLYNITAALVGGVHMTLTDD